MPRGSSVLLEVKLWKPRDWMVYISGFFLKSENRVKQVFVHIYWSVVSKKSVLHNLIFHIDRSTLRNRVIG